MEKDQEMEFFKEKLFSNFKDAGILEHLKGQMRYNIVEKLQKRNLTKDSNKENRNTLNQTKENTLNYRLLISLVSEFLEFHGYNYTRAVFLPEAKYSNQTLSRDEMFELLHLSKVVSKEDPTPLLTKIIDYADHQLDVNKDKMSVQCQTDFEGRNTNLEEKLRNVDYEYLQRIDGERFTSQQSFDEKFIKFKRDYEQRMKAEMAAEITRIKEFELANIRLDEAEKYRLKMEQYREELDRVYTEKLQKLRERERDTIERCKQQLKALESASYDYRQKFLKDLEIHKLKEEGLDTHIGMEKESMKMQKERLQELERDLQRQFKDLEDQKRTTIKRNDEMKTSYKADVSREADEDRVAVIHMKAKLENETSKAEQYKNTAENYEGQNKRLLEENAQIMEEVRRLREIKKTQEVEVEKSREAMQILKKSLEKDEGYIKKYDVQIQEYQEEIKNHKAATQEYKEIVQQRKREQIEANQKFIKEIEFYQNEIEKIEKERDALRQRIYELENEANALAQSMPPQTAEMGLQKDSFRNSNIQGYEPKRDSHRQSYMAETMNRYRHSTIMEEDDEGPVRRLDEIDKELRELKERRENVLLGYGSSSGDKRHTKAHSSSPRFEREKSHKRSEDVQFSPHFKPYTEEDSELMRLQKQKQQIKNEIGLDESKSEHSKRFDDSISLGRGSDFKKAHPRDHFDHISDKYTDKILQDLHSFDQSYDKSPYGAKDQTGKGKMKFEDITASEKKAASNKLPETLPKKNEQYSGVKDIFKVESPEKKGLVGKFDKLDNKGKTDPFEESIKSDKSLLDSFSGDNPKPIVFTNKNQSKKEAEKPAFIAKKVDSKPISPAIQSSSQPKKVEKKEELPPSIASSNLSRLDKPKLAEIGGPKGKLPEKSSPLTLPSDFGAKGKTKEEPKKINQKGNSGLDAILGDQRKTTEELDFEEIDEELLEY